MVEIKPPGGVQPPVAPSTEAPTKPITQATTPTGIPEGAVSLNPEAVAKALKDYQKLRNKLKHPSLSGAAGLFTDNVVFPAELLDPKNPANDPKYLHLLLAMFGMKEMKQFFATDEQRSEEEEMEKEAHAGPLEKEKDAHPVRKKPDPRGVKS